MKKTKIIPLDFEVDRLTNSIVNTLTGETLDTEVVKMSKNEFIIQSDWEFDWMQELKKTDREIFKLVSLKNPEAIHALISLAPFNDHVWIHLIESAKFNRGKSKVFDGAPANLVAFAAKLSFEIGFDGYVLFAAKSKLIEHYEKMLGAKRLYGTRMFIDTPAALRLVRRYFKDFNNA
jgi:hypothetical protein